VRLLLRLARRFRGARSRLLLRLARRFRGLRLRLRLRCPCGLRLRLRLRLLRCWLPGWGVVSGGRPAGTSSSSPILQQAVAAARKHTAASPVRTMARGRKRP